MRPLYRNVSELKKEKEKKGPLPNVNSVINVSSTIPTAISFTYKQNSPHEFSIKWLEFTHKILVNMTMPAACLSKTFSSLA